jgi:two-component system, chemotaxis family, CheB/CheR fusion protein
MTSTDEQQPLDVLLEYLKGARGFDFSGYKRSSLERRVAKRMDATGSASYPSYIEFLDVHPDEFASLFDTILINVTGFFRDTVTWDFLVSDTLPRLLANRADGEPIRVWCAGCSSGEETYTLAILLAQALGDQQYLDRVKIYATDVDERALSVARAGAYTARQVEAVPRDALDRFFDRVDQRYAFRKDLRRNIIFGRNDLVQDAPISRVDLLACRNTLMYFNAETQGQILRRLHFALKADGFLLLGKSEMLITHGDLFAPVSLKRRVFSKVAKQSLRDRLLSVAHPPGAEPGPESDRGFRQAAFDVAPVAQVVVDREGRLVLANQAARSAFGLAMTDLGRQLKELELSYRPVELRGNLELAFRERRPVTLDGIRATSPGGEPRHLEVSVRPLDVGGGVTGASIAYLDLTIRHGLEQELERSKQELGTAYEELQSTVEELETSNEELQSTNDELETSNEELQSTNEELETMNEELQSTNEELQTINDELRQRTLELDQVNAFLEAILTSMGVAVVVVDRQLCVRIWNRRAEDLWGLRSEEAEAHHILSLDMGLQVDRLKDTLRACLIGGSAREQLELAATDGRGRPFVCRITAMPLAVAPDHVTGVIVLMERELEQMAAAG